MTYRYEVELTEITSYSTTIESDEPMTKDEIEEEAIEDVINGRYCCDSQEGICVSSINGIHIDAYEDAFIKVTVWDVFFENSKGEADKTQLDTEESEAGVELYNLIASLAKELDIREVKNIVKVGVEYREEE